MTNQSKHGQWYLATGQAARKKPNCPCPVCKAFRRGYQAGLNSKRNPHYRAALESREIVRPGRHRTVSVKVVKVTINRLDVTLRYVEALMNPVVSQRTRALNNEMTARFLVLKDKLERMRAELIWYLGEDDGTTPVAED